MRLIFAAFVVMLVTACASAGLFESAFESTWETSVENNICTASLKATNVSSKTITIPNLKKYVYAYDAKGNQIGLGWANIVINNLAPQKSTVSKVQLSQGSVWLSAEQCSDVANLVIDRVSYSTYLR